VGKKSQKSLSLRFLRKCDSHSSKINGLSNAPRAERGNMG
jgi:hypothetical protein